jgi:hypothetical protein
MFTDQRYIANCILNSEKEMYLCPTQLNDGARNRQSPSSVISRGTVLLGSCRRGEIKEERYVRRRVFEEAGG